MKVYRDLLEKSAETVWEMEDRELYSRVMKDQAKTMPGGQGGG